MISDSTSGDDYAAQEAIHPSLTVIDILSEQRSVTESYRNQVMADVNDHCMRMSVIEGEYRWHHHPGSDEIFVVVMGALQIEIQNGACVELREWQSFVVPAGTVHRTRAVGRTVNITFERRNAETIFLE